MSNNHAYNFPVFFSNDSKQSCQLSFFRKNNFNPLGNFIRFISGVIVFVWWSEHSVCCHGLHDFMRRRKSNFSQNWALNSCLAGTKPQTAGPQWSNYVTIMYFTYASAKSLWLRFADPFAIPGNILCWLYSTKSFLTVYSQFIKLHRIQLFWQSITAIQFDIFEKIDICP